MSSGVPPPEIYFADDFDPYSLKVAQLRNILLQHSRALPSNAKKADLVQEFIAGVLPLKQAILKAQSKVKSSSAGITIMGEPHLDEPVSPVRRRKSRQSLAAQAQAQEEAEDGEDEDPAREEPPKAKRSSRRSSALPASTSASSLAVPGAGKKIRRTRSREVLPEPPQQVQEESEPEEEVYVALPSPSPPPVAEEEKPKKKHRESAKHPAFADVEEKEGFSDYNPFQSGGESPDQKRAKKLRRKSSLGVGSSSAPSTSKRRQSELPHGASSRTTGGMSSSFSIPNLGGFRSPESSPVNTPVKADPPLADKSFKNKGRKSLPAGLTAQRFMPDVESLQTPPSEWKEAQRSASGSLGKKKEAVERERSYESGDGELLMVEDSDEGEEAVGARESVPEEKEEEDENAGFVKHNNVVSRKLSNLERSASPAKTPSSSTSSALVPSKPNKKKSSSALSTRPKSTSSSSVVKTSSVVLPSLGALLSLFLYLLQWTSKSSSLGFCDPNSNTNSILLSRQEALASARLCIERHASGEEDVAPYGDGAVCDASALPLLPSFIPTPTSCTPCPNHGICVAGTFVGCDKEYILRPNLVESLVSMVGAEGALQFANGVPGLGSVAFPPSCVPDNEKRKLVGGMARAIEGELAKERGRGVCEAGIARDGEDEEFGVAEIKLREEFLERKDPSFKLDQFLEIFNIAVKDLVDHGDIVSGVDSNGHRWLAAHRGEMGLVCQARVGTKEALHANKSTLTGIGATLVAILVARSKLNSSMEESTKVKELVQVALTKLREQERVHYLDPVQAAEPFIAPAHLRDLVLQNEPAAVRQRLWKKVGAIVEGNSNVNTREEEVRGEVHSVWEWKGVSLA